MIISTSQHAQLSTADAAACLHLDIYIFDADAGAESEHRQSTDNLDLSCAGLGRRSSHRAPEYIHYV